MKHSSIFMMDAKTNWVHRGHDRFDPAVKITEVDGLTVVDGIASNVRFPDIGCTMDTLVRFVERIPD